MKQLIIGAALLAAALPAMAQTGRRWCTPSR